uniref:Uncharacterized protein n=1 Tax=Anguilla anguilla TaxID=7936 RepID=A0A0E9V977_ANGAN
MSFHFVTSSPHHIHRGSYVFMVTLSAKIIGEKLSFMTCVAFKKQRISKPLSVNWN